MLKAFGLLGFALLGTDGAVLRTMPEKVPGEYVIVMQPNATLSDMDRHIHTLNLKCQSKQASYSVLSEFRALGHFKGYGAKLDAQALAELLADDAVAYVEENAVATLQQEPCVRQVTADWGLPRIPLKYFDAKSNKYDYVLRDESWVNVYVVDSGIRTTHLEFEGRAVWGTDTSTGAANPTKTDEDGHGTHVAAIVGGRTYGVVKSVRIVDVRTMDARGVGSSITNIAGVNWVAQDCRARGKTCICNLSISMPTNRGTDDAVNAAHDAGVLMVVASGNSRLDACTRSPPSATHALVVNAANVSDVPGTFSNWGACTHIYAPGVNIRSADITSDTNSRVASGTSQAAPFVAGVAARLLAAEPSLTPSQLRDKILAGATQGAIVRNLPADTPNTYVYLPCS